MNDVRVLAELHEDILLAVHSLSLVELNDVRFVKRLDGAEPHLGQVSGQIHAAEGSLADLSDELVLLNAALGSARRLLL